MKRFLALALVLCTLLLAVSCGVYDVTEGTNSSIQTVPSTEGGIGVQDTEDTAPPKDTEPEDTEPEDTEPAVPEKPFVASEAHSMIGSAATAYTVGEDRYDINCDAYLLKEASAEDYNSLLANSL